MTRWGLNISRTVGQLTFRTQGRDWRQFDPLSDDEEAKTKAVGRRNYQPGMGSMYIAMRNEKKADKTKTITQKNLPILVSEFSAQKRN